MSAPSPMRVVVPAGGIGGARFLRGLLAAVPDLPDLAERGLDVTVVGNTAYVLEAKLNYQRDPALKGKDPAPFKAYAVPLK